MSRQQISLLDANHEFLHQLHRYFSSNYQPSLYHLLIYLRPVFENLVPSGSKYKEINGKTIREFAIPLPPLKTQHQIVTECEVVDSSASSILAEGISLSELRSEIKKRKDDVFRNRL